MDNKPFQMNPGVFGGAISSEAVVPFWYEMGSLSLHDNPLQDRRKGMAYPAEDYS